MRTVQIPDDLFRLDEIVCVNTCDQLFLVFKVEGDIEWDESGAKAFYPELQHGHVYKQPYGPFVAPNKPLAAFNGIFKPQSGSASTNIQLSVHENDSNCRDK
jgi:hypothetical protein